MKDKLAKLINVKSIMTLVMVCVFAYLSVSNRLTGEQFLGIFTVVVAFYFGTQAKKE